MSSSSAKPGASSANPNCPICGGSGFIRQDLPISHPEFGRLQLCACQQKASSDAARRRLYRLSNLDALKRMTFDTFNTAGLVNAGEKQAETLHLAYNHAWQFSQNPDGWLLLMGGYGCGKTHLAAAIANAVVELAIPTLFLTVPDLLDWLRSSFGGIDESFEARFEEIRNIRLLILDDLGTQNATPWSQEKLYQIINHRYINRLPTVITTNLQLDELEGRIRSRLHDPELVNKIRITASDHRFPDDDTSHPPLSTLHHHSSRTFGSFSLREPEKLSPEQQSSLKKGFHAAHQFAEKPQGWLLFLGGYGAGKTHLAAAIGNYRHGLGEAPIFVVVPDLLDHLRATFNPQSAVSYDRMFEQVRACPLLILDDLGTQSATPWAREKLYQIFNYRYTAELSTVITSSDLLEEMDPRIRSRMLDRQLCSIYLLDVPAYRSAANSAVEKKTARSRSRDAK
ncbi:MAG: ATP-binding protein [Anaerolineaceae bacterium]|nr:ATP-binding protein [Anaerolineaceae bacterium]